MSRFADEMPPVPPCWTCLHKHPGTATCAAYPGGIPHKILTGRHQHREPYPGDNGIMYEPDPEDFED